MSDTMMPSRERYFDENLDVILSEVRETFLRKRSDYGFENLMVDGSLGIVVRMTDKLYRIRNLYKSDTRPANESIEDTWMDLVGYAIAGLCLTRDYLDANDRPSWDPKADHKADVTTSAEHSVKVGYPRNYEEARNIAQTMVNAVKFPMVYLGGSIEEIPLEVASSWRAQAKDFLTEHGIAAYDPLTEAGSLFREGRIREAWDKNTAHLKSCKAAIFNVFPGTQSIGSIREMQIAVDNRVPVYYAGSNYLNPSLIDVKYSGLDWMRALEEIVKDFRHAQLGN